MKARYLRLPPFRVALLASFLAAAAFGVWIFLDASFYPVFDLVCIDLKVKEHPGVDLWEFHAWNALGLRLLVFCFVASVAILSTLFVGYRLFVGDRRGRSLRSWLLAITLVSCWLGLFFSYDRLVNAGLSRRVQRAMPGFKTDALLMKAWPTTHGELPFSGRYAVVSSVPDYLVLINAEPLTYQLRERVEPFISRTLDGGFRFDVGSSEVKVEFHPHGGTPASFRSAFPPFLDTDSELSKSVRLDQDWYLAWYAVKPRAE